MKERGLHGGQFDSRSVAAAKTLVVDRHLLALQLGADAADVDDRIGRPGEFQCRRELS